MILFNKLIRPITSFNFYGEVGSLGMFDPLNITNSLSENQIQFWRESELQNGRLSLFSNLLPIYLNIKDPNYNFIINIYLFYFICFEIYRYQNAFDKFYLKINKQPGYYNNYIPLNLSICILELNVLRLSMIVNIFKNWV